MLSKSFNKILNSYAKIDDSGIYPKISKSDKDTIKNSIYQILVGTGSKKSSKNRMEFYKILIKEGNSKKDGFKIYIWDERYCTSDFTKGIYMLYSFSSDGLNFELSINQGSDFPSPEKKNIIARNFRNLNLSQLDRFREYDRYYFKHQDILIYKGYGSNVSENILVSDLKDIYMAYFLYNYQYWNEINKNANKLNSENKFAKTDNFEIEGDLDEKIENNLIELEKEYKNSKMDLSDIFKKIRGSYKDGKYGNLSHEDEDILKSEIIRILNSIEDSKLNKEPYRNFPHSGIQIFIQKGIGNSNRIKIYIGHEKCNNFSVNDGLYLLYSFSEDGSRIRLSLSIGSNSIDLDDRARIGKSLHVKVPVGFLKRRGKGYSEAILRIWYGGNDLGENWLERDLKNLYYVYLGHINQYNNLSMKVINKKSINKDIISKVKFQDYLLNKGFVFSKRIIENYLLSLKVKQFVILTGNSGTGKTKLSQLFAEYLNDGFDDNYAIIPVGANWTENRNVVGYYNVLTNSYQHTPSLDLILRAKNNPNKPYFLILDEMNLSHVERYFSDFLSSMESSKPIPLHEADDIVDVPEELSIPNNVFIIGTVNVDETTYMFSPKVLDRANVLEFKTFEDISMNDYVKNNSPKFKLSGDVVYLEDSLSDVDLRENILSIVNNDFTDVKYNQINKILENNEGIKKNTVEISVLLEISNELTKFNDYLSGSGFEFGYRTVNEILAFMVVAWKYEGEQEVWDNWRRYFDAQILQKILPKLHGSQTVLGETLDNLLAHCLGVENVDEIDDLSNIDLNEFNAPYIESAKKLIQMKNVLEKQRYVSFIS